MCIKNRGAELRCTVPNLHQRMDLLYFTIIGAGLYFFSDWALDRIERARGARFRHRDAIYFGIMLTAVLLTFTLVIQLHKTNPGRTGKNRLSTMTSQGCAKGGWQLMPLKRD